MRAIGSLRNKLTNTKKNIQDKTIAEEFNTYKFADYKQTVIDLIKRVTTVSVQTMKIVKEMKEIKTLEKMINHYITTKRRLEINEL